MKKQKFSEFLDQLKDLTETQRVALREILGKGQLEKSPTALVDEMFAGNPVSPASVLCIEQSRILIKFAKDCGLAFETISTKQRRGREKVFHVQKVNAYHSRLKNWMRRFHGVATERLPSYLGWRHLHEQALSSPEEWLRASVK